MHVNNNKSVQYNNIYKIGLRRISNGDRLTSLVCCRGRMVVEWAVVSYKLYTGKRRKTDTILYHKYDEYVYNADRGFQSWYYDDTIGFVIIRKQQRCFTSLIGVFTWLFGRKRAATPPPPPPRYYKICGSAFYNIARRRLINAVPFRRAASHTIILLLLSSLL